LDATKFFASLREMEAALIRTDRAGTATATRMRSSFQGVIPGINALRGAISSLAGALAIREVIQYADSGTVFAGVRPLPRFGVAHGEHPYGVGSSPLASSARRCTRRAPSRLRPA
jgi:hypothetical protein